MIKTHSRFIKNTSNPLLYKYITLTAGKIIVKEQITGDKIGPSQATGIRNNKSHVKNEAGQ